MNWDQHEALFAAYLAGALHQAEKDDERSIDGDARKAFDAWLEKNPGQKRGRVELGGVRNYASVERLISRENKIEFFAGGVFESEQVLEIINLLRNAARVEGRPLFTEQQITTLKKVRRYFWDHREQMAIPVDWTADAKYALDRVLEVAGGGE